MKLKALPRITKVLEYATWTALSFLSLLVAYQVIARYILNDPSSTIRPRASSLLAQIQSGKVHKIGDCVQPRKAIEAVHEGFLLGRKI